MRYSVMSAPCLSCGPRCPPQPIPRTAPGGYDIVRRENSRPCSPRANRVPWGWPGRPRQPGAVGMAGATAPTSDGRSQTSPSLSHMKTVSPRAVTNGRTKPWSLSGHATLHAYVMHPSRSRQRTLMPPGARGGLQVDNAPVRESASPRRGRHDLRLVVLRRSRQDGVTSAGAPAKSYWQA
jgi:hypothetical protein